MENTINIEAATYVVTRQFSDGSRKKQDLLRAVITQKLAEQDRLPAKENMNYNSLCELAPKGDYE